MALPASGPISLNAVNVELGREATITISLNDAIVRTLFAISSGQIAMSNGHGKSNASPPTFYYLDDGEEEVGNTIAAYVTNPNNPGLAYTASYLGSNGCGGGNARLEGGTYTGTLPASGTHAISGPAAINGVIASYKANTIGEAGYYSVDIYFPSFNLTLSGGTSTINIRGPDYQETVWYDNECCRSNGGDCNYGSCTGQSVTVTTDETENCCCYDCNNDGITACGDPADPEYDDSNPPCRDSCNDNGDGSACGSTTNYYYDCNGNGTWSNCPYSQVETNYDILASTQC